ncbi:MAG: lipopolysaccharide biosynthesis protein [Candidatus Hodarchaeota archaeon]
MSEITKLFKQSSHYASSQILLVIAGFISFPILTRAFSVSDYGILSLVTTSIFIIMPFTKLGMQHSSIRYYEECKSGKRKESTSHFYSTLFFGSIVLTILMLTLLWLILQFIPSTLIHPRIASFVIFVAILVFLRSVQGILKVFYRTEQKSVSWSIIEVIQRYGTLALGLFFLFFVLKSLYGYYIGMVVADSLVLLFLLYTFFHKADVHWKYISVNFFKESVKYALPLVGVEISAILITFADRYLIQYLLGLEPLGIYSACNNMIRYVSLIVLLPVNLALLPICMNIWVNKGKQQTSEFLTKTLRYFCLVAFPISLGFIATGKDLIVLLASEKYVESHVIIPYVIIGKMLLASCNIFNVAWFLYKKTSIYAILTFISFLCNLILNIVLIQGYGILGAAYATLITYILLFTLISYFSFKYLSFKIDYSHIALYLTFSVIMYMVIKNIGSINYLPFYLVLKVCLGIITYSSLVLIFDKTIRSHSKKYLNDIQAKALRRLPI